MTFGIDYAWGRPSNAAMKSAGVKFVCRYVSTDGNTKNLTKAEADRLGRAGFDIVVVFETSAGRAGAGYAAGAHDARSAMRQTKACGAPSDDVIYFAVDFDAAGASLTRVGEYFEGVRSVLPKSRVGAYGGVAVMDYLFRRGLIGYGWETYAWQYRNHGRPWHPRARLQQYSNGHTIDGVSVDFNRANHPDFGQWQHPKNVAKKEGTVGKWFPAWALWLASGKAWKRPGSAPKRIPKKGWKRLKGVTAAIKQHLG